jgi:hypothetical protein
VYFLIGIVVLIALIWVIIESSHALRLF